LTLTTGGLLQWNCQQLTGTQQEVSKDRASPIYKKYPVISMAYFYDTGTSGRRQRFLFCPAARFAVPGRQKRGPCRRLCKGLRLPLAKTAYIKEQLFSRTLQSPLTAQRFPDRAASGAGDRINDRNHAQQSGS
jgi:hypothetical protein